jgi:hypothetical protein
MHSQPAPHQTHCLHFILMGWTVEEILCTSYKRYATIKLGDTDLCKLFLLELIVVPGLSKITIRLLKEMKQN